MSASKKKQILETSRLFVKKNYEALIDYFFT